MKKSKYSVWKSEKHAQAKMLQFCFYSGPSAPLPSTGFGPPVRSRGHIKDNSNYAWFGMEGPYTQKALKRKYSSHLLFFVLFFFKILIKAFESTCLPQSVTCSLARQAGGDQRLPGALCRQWGKHKPDSPRGTAAAHLDMPDSATQATGCHGKLGVEHWGSDAQSSGLHGKEPGQTVLL